MRTSHLFLQILTVVALNHVPWFSTGFTNPLHVSRHAIYSHQVMQDASPSLVPITRRTLTSPSLVKLNMSSIDHEPDSLKDTPISPPKQKEYGLPSLLSKNISYFFLGFDPNKLKSILVAAIFMISVLLTPIQDAMAAPSGGRMGGSFGGSNNRSSSSSSMRTYSSPSRSFGGGYSYYSRPNIIVTPPIFGGGYGYFGAPVLAPGVTVVRTGPSFVSFLSTAFIGLILFSTISSITNRSLTNMDGGSSSASDSALGPGVTVAQISVALNVPRRNDPSSILSYLDRLSSTARTDSRVGVSNLVSQVALELLRQKRSIFAAETEYKHYNDANRAQRDFNNSAIRERSKFERESVNRFGGVDYNDGVKSTNRMTDGFNPQATAVVVTLIVSIDGDSTKLSKINGMSDLENALTRIATDVKVDDCLRSAEVLWTPEDPKDVLTERDVVADYPKLRRI